MLCITFFLKSEIKLEIFKGVKVFNEIIIKTLQLFLLKFLVGLLVLKTVVELYFPSPYTCQLCSPFSKSKNGREPCEILHFLPVFGCLGDSAWNCIPTVYSVVMGQSFFSNQDFSAKGVVKGVCECGVAPRPLPRLKSRGQKKDNPKIEV